MAADASLRNQFLLAMPGLAGSYFGETATYLCEHDAEGAMGLVINRPGPMMLVELLAQLGLATGRVAADVPVLDGGPVARDRGFILHSAEQDFEHSLALGNGLMLTASRDVLERIADGAGPADYLVVLGYAGWGAGQLEQELADNAWLTCPATTAAAREVLFQAPFDQRLQRTAALLGIDLRFLSGHAGHA